MKLLRIVLDQHDRSILLVIGLLLLFALIGWVEARRRK
jgi:hypothetical protein